MVPWDPSIDRQDLKAKEGLKEYYAKIHDYACAARIGFAVGKAMEILQM